MHGRRHCPFLLPSASLVKGLEGELRMDEEQKEALKKLAKGCGCCLGYLVLIPFILIVVWIFAVWFATDIWK